MASCWEVLGIERTTNIMAIKRAYAKQAALCHPEDNPEGFSLLHEAYLDAMARAKKNEKPTLEVREHERAVPTDSESTPQPPPRFHFPSAVPEQHREEPSPSRSSTPAASMTFPKPTLQTQQEQPIPRVQTEEVKKPSGWTAPFPKPLTQDIAATAARESFDSALATVRLDSSRRTILELLEETRKAFPQSIRKKPWEYIITRPEFSDVRLDAVFLKELLTFMRNRKLATGFWPVWADAYSTEFTRLPNEHDTPGNSQSSTEDTVSLLFQIKQTIDKQLADQSKEGADENSWRTRIGTFFTRKRDTDSQ